jgi:hypothetical protein
MVEESRSHPLTKIPAVDIHVCSYKKPRKRFRHINRKLLSTV